MIPNLNDKAPGSRKTIFATVFVAIFLITIVGSVAISFVMPASYASTSRILADISTSNLDSNSARAEFNVILSDAVLSQVVEKLNLSPVWGRKHLNSENLSTPETLKLLKSRLSLLPIHNTRIIEITAYSENQLEAAQIANAVAKTYQEFCRKKHAAERAQDPVNQLIIADLPVLLIDQAQTSSQPSRPNKTVNIILGVVAGVIFGTIAGAFVAFVLPRFGIKTVRD